MAKKIKWLNRELFESPVYYCLCKNKKQFKKALNHIGNNIKDYSFLNPYANATTHFFTNSTGSTAIVCIDDKNASMIQVHSLLVHEAVHIWQEVKYIIGEKDPSMEFEAYSIQAISQRLMETYNA